jgi:glycosyltransferase involved in cell wall biosynthesis
MANFQTDLSAYSGIILPSPLDQYSMWLLKMVEGYLYSFSTIHTIFYPSMPVYHYLVSAGVPAEKLVQLGRGVDTEQFNPSLRDEKWRRQLAPKGEIILACVGRLAPEKGFPFLAQVAIRLHELGLPFKLLLVGGNKNASVEESIRSAFDPVGDRVVFTGFLEGAALACAYATADVFVHCSATETFGLVVLEAMACGLPVVARDAGGPSEIIQDGESGFLIAPDDLPAFVARVTELTTDATLRERMSNAARLQAEDTTWEKINLRVAQRMATALKERAARPPRKSLDLGYQALNWIVAFFAAVVTELRFTGALIVITLFWAIGVLPMLVHGNVVFWRRTAAAAAANGGSMGKVANGKVKVR